MEKKREYAERVERVEDGSFTPMVMLSAVGMEPECAFVWSIWWLR